MPVRPDPLEGVPDVTPWTLDQGWSGIVDGIGGTGVVTIGAVLGMAAHLEGKGLRHHRHGGAGPERVAPCSAHIRIAETPERISAIRVSAGKADLVLGCDLVVSANKKVLSAVREGETLFVANTAEVMPGDFARSADFSLPTERIKKAIREAAGEERAHFFDASKAAAALFGNSLAANMMLLGLSYQRGGLPLTAEAIEKAIVLNGQAVQMNIAAFPLGASCRSRSGRHRVHDEARRNGRTPATGGCRSTRSSPRGPSSSPVTRTAPMRNVTALA